MKKDKWNFAVVKSLFGDLWIGKTRLPLYKERIFASFDKAKEKAEYLFRNQHENCDFEDENSEEYDDEVNNAWNNLQDSDKDSAEPIDKQVEHFIVS